MAQDIISKRHADIANTKSNLLDKLDTIDNKHTPNKTESDQKPSDFTNIFSQNVFRNRTWSFPYRFYIYDLPARFNSNITDCVHSYLHRHVSCGDMSWFGNGAEFARDHELSVRYTWMFSLEAIVHHKLLHSRYRTLDPAQAHFFYIPYYSGLNCLCEKPNRTFSTTDNLRALAEFLHVQQPYTANRPHLMTLSKIEREQGTQSCAVLHHSMFAQLDVAFIGIEQDIWRRQTTKPLIVAPYPSYGHFLSDQPLATARNQYLTTLYSDTRDVTLFLASGTRFASHGGIRARVIKQLPRPIYSTYDAYTRLHPNMTSQPSNVFLATPECWGKHHEYTMTWMKHSLFCLQPSGDSPTRKSFYDAIISGCIPVLFNVANKRVKYPFDTHLNYSAFTVQLEEADVNNGALLTDLMKPYMSRAVIERMQAALLQVVPFFQYNVLVSNSTTDTHDDALYYVLQDVKELLLEKSASV